MRQVLQQTKRKTGAKRGQPVDCTVRTGCEAIVEAGVVEPYAEKKKKNVFERKNTCQLQSQDGGQCRWTVGIGVPRKKVRNSCPGEYIRWLQTLKLERSPTERGFWGQVRPNNVETRDNRQMGCRVSTGSLTWDLRGALNVKPVVDNVGP